MVTLKNIILRNLKIGIQSMLEEEKNFYYEQVQLINYSKGGDYNLSFVTSDGKAINTGHA